MHQFLLTDPSIIPTILPGRLTAPQRCIRFRPEALTLFTPMARRDGRSGLPPIRATSRHSIAKYASKREMERIPVTARQTGPRIRLSPGEHSALIRDIIIDFAPRFAPDSILIYAGDTGDKMGYFDDERLAALGV